MKPWRENYYRFVQLFCLHFPAMKRATEVLIKLIYTAYKVSRKFLQNCNDANFFLDFHFLTPMLRPFLHQWLGVLLHSLVHTSTLKRWFTYLSIQFFCFILIVWHFAEGCITCVVQGEACRLKCEKLVKDAATHIKFSGKFLYLYLLWQLNVLFTASKIRHLTIHILPLSFFNYESRE